MIWCWWYLTRSLNILDRNSKHVSLYLEPTKADLSKKKKIDFHIDYELILLNHVDPKKGKVFFTTALNTEWVSGEGCGADELISHAELFAEGSNFINKNGKVHIVVTIREHIIPTLVEKDQQLAAETNASDGFFDLITSPDAATITFGCTDGILVKAFRQILAVKSEVSAKCSTIEKTKQWMWLNSAAMSCENCWDSYTLAESNRRSTRSTCNFMLQPNCSRSKDFRRPVLIRLRKDWIATTLQKLSHSLMNIMKMISINSVCRLSIR